MAGAASAHVLSVYLPSDRFSTMSRIRTLTLVGWIPWCLAGVGCAELHTRWVEDLDEVLADSSRILLVQPDVEVSVKNFQTDTFFVVDDLSATVGRHVRAACREELRRRGLRVTPRTDPADERPTPEILTELREALLLLADEVIESDLAYDRRRIPEELSARDAIPERLRGRFDLMATLRVRIQTETGKETFWRWFGNIGWNLLTLPISIASSFIPITMPISVNISTSIFVPSPDRIFATCIVVDGRTGRVVYQSDYYSRSAPVEPDQVVDLVEELLSDLGPDPED